MEERVDELRALVRGQSPHLTARRSGAIIAASSAHGTTLALQLWDTVFHITWPEVHAVEAASGEPCRASVESALLYYLSTADGTPPSGEWISFQQLPGGTFYNRAFQGYSGDELVRHFGDDVKAFRCAAERSGGAPFAWSDAGFSFLALPRVPLALVYWRGHTASVGEEGIPTKAQVLFDRTASHYMPTDALAGLGAQLIHRIKGAAT